MTSATQRDYKKISKTYYEVIRVVENYIEIKSRCTKHCWIISRPYDIANNKPIIIYHKHHPSIPYYHRHGYAYTITQALRNIESHDRYVLSGFAKYNK